MTSLTALLGIQRPIIQAPMAGVQGSALAAAVSAAGGLGSLPCAMLSVEGIRAEVEALRRATDQPFNLNFFCHTNPVPDPAREDHWRRCLMPFYNEFGIDPETIVAGPGRQPFNETLAELVVELRPAVVSFHFGLPEPDLLARVKRSGAKVLASATTLEEAVWLEARGADAIIAQGLEAGGHRGHFLSAELGVQMGTFALVPQLVSRVSVPVIAAGGLASAETVAAAQALGAVGVQVGTAYLLCPEATTSAVHRAALKSPEACHTEVTNLFTGRPARGIVNRVMRELGALRPDVPAFPLATSAIGPLRSAAEAQGSGDFSPLWAGQNVSGCEAVQAAEMTVRLMSHWRD